MFALLFLILIFVDIGCANGIAPEEEWNKTFGGTDWGVVKSVQQTTDDGYILAGYTVGSSDFWLMKTDSNGIEQWSKTFGGTDEDYARAVQQTNDGSYILIGCTSSYGAGSSDFWLVKIDSSGIEQWNKTFGGTDGDWASSVQQTTDDGYILAGSTKSYNANGVDFWLVKTDSNGNEQWNKTFGGTRWEYADSVQQTTDGGYILTGCTGSYGAGSNDFWLVKTDSNGIEQWNKTFGGTNDDSAYSVQQTTDGGYILAGFTESYGDSCDNSWLVKTDSNGIVQWNKTFEGTNSVQQTTDGGYILAGDKWTGDADRTDSWLVKIDLHGNEQWNKTFGGTRGEYAYSVQQTTDDGYIFAGKTWSYGAGYDNSWLVKTDSNGNEQWNKTFVISAFNDANSVQQTTDGGYILIGSTSLYGAGEADFWLVKTDSNGNEQWNKTFGGTDEDWASSVQQTTDDGYILAGSTGSYGAGSSDFWLVKTDSNGNEQWNNTFGGTNWESAYSVQQTTDGGYILAGSTTSYGAGSNDFWLVKTDSKGNEQWNKTFGGTDDDWASSVQQTTDGGYILAGDTLLNDAGLGIDSWLVKIDSYGNEQWNKTFGGIKDDSAITVQQTTDGGYILVGFTFSYSADNSDFWLMKTDSNGIEQWNKTFGGTNWESAYSVQQTTDGGYILVGSTTSYGAGENDFWLVKTDSNGNEQWNKTFGGTNWESAYSVQQTTDGGYILVGSTTSYGAGKRNYWLIKVSGENNDWKNEWVGEESDAGSTITTNELQDIIHHWLENISVREHIISILDLQEMIDIWLSG